MVYSRWIGALKILKSLYYKNSSKLRNFTIITCVELLVKRVSHLKPTGYVMHQQFNIQQLYALPTLYLCVLYLSENKQRLVPLTA